MAQANLQLRKLAWIRDEEYPAGVSAPGHFECPCTTPKTRVPAGYFATATGGGTCPNCQTVYDSQGWIYQPATIPQPRTHDATFEYGKRFGND